MFNQRSRMNRKNQIVLNLIQTPLGYSIVEGDDLVNKASTSAPVHQPKERPPHAPPKRILPLTQAKTSSSPSTPTPPASRSTIPTKSTPPCLPAPTGSAYRASMRLKRKHWRSGFGLGSSRLERYEVGITSEDGAPREERVAL